MAEIDGYGDEIIWHDRRRVYTEDQLKERGMLDYFTDTEWLGKGRKVKENESPSCYLRTSIGFIGLYHSDQTLWS